MADLRASIFRTLEDAGRAAIGSTAETMTLREAWESLGGRRGGTRALAAELGVTQRSVQRYLASETGSARQVRTPRGLQAARLRNVTARELRRAGARALRDRGGRFAPDSTIQLCYAGKSQGERDIGDVEIDNADWIDAFDAGADAEQLGDTRTAEQQYRDMEQAFTETTLEAYGVSGGGDMSICEDGAEFELSAA
jgi:hypothetical protein